MDFDPTLIREIRTVYTEDMLDFSDVPDLKELAESRGISYKIVRQIADRENWEGLRNRNRASYGKELAKVREEAINRMATDTVRVMENTIRHNLHFLYEELPKIKEKLHDRVEDMTTKELLSFFRILMQLEKDTLTVIEKVYKTPDNELGKDYIDVADSVTDLSEIVGELDGEKSTENSERDSAFADFDG